LCSQKRVAKNRFGKLYFHRGSSEKENSFLYDRGGFDVCLSDSDYYYFGILIRSAWINHEEKPVCGPGLLTRRIVKHISQKEKEKAVEIYMRDHGKTGTAENVKELPGYVSDSIIAKLTAC
jgi:hypothetical protein